MAMITAENKIPEVIKATPSTNAEFKSSFTSEDWSVYNSAINSQL
jgi:hypothetical protein